MNSTVRDTFTVLILSSALVLGLVLTAPAALPAADVASTPSTTAFATTVGADAAGVAEGAMIATLTAEAPVVAGLATLRNTANTPVTAQPVRRKSGKSSRIRQSMAMPFFSFAHRG